MHTAADIPGAVFGNRVWYTSAVDRHLQMSVVPPQLALLMQSLMMAVNRLAAESRNPLQL